MRPRLAFVGLAGMLCFVLLLLSSCSLFEQPGNAIAASTLVTSPIPSSGCGKLAPFAPGLSENKTISSGGYERLYRIHLPVGYRSTRPQPLVLNFHGHDSNAAAQERLTKLSLLADQDDFLAVYPQGIIGPDNQSGWATGPAWDPQVNDVLFVSDLLNRLQAQYCIDPLRIYAMGFSNGGGMANLLARQMAGRIAAFASVSGSYYPIGGGSYPARAVPFLEMHGTADSVVPYNGSRVKDYSSVTSWLLKWAQKDHCSSHSDIFLKLKTMIGMQWLGCQAGTTIIHYRILHEGHKWPRVLFPEQIQQKWRFVTATTLIWQFFQDHPMMNNSQQQPASRKNLTLHLMKLLDRREYENVYIHML
jgi:polyhydroxybutyrate depolymerase